MKDAKNMSGIEIIVRVDGHAIDGDNMNYTTDCPYCDNEIEWEQFFDPDIKHTCPKCKKDFYVKKVWIDDDNFVQ